MTMVELNEKALEVGQRVEKFTGEARWFGTILSTYTTGRGKVRHVVEVEPQGFQMIAVPEQLRPAPAALPDADGLVERLRTVSDMINMGEKIRWGEETALMDQAAIALQSRDETIARLERERNESARAWRKYGDDMHQRAMTAEARLSRAEEVVRGVLDEETVSVHVGYDNGPGGGNYVYADAVRVDSDAFRAAREFLEGGEC